MERTEKKKNDKKFWIILVVVIAALICMREIEVPKDTVFVMGDNRNHSSDSREPMIGPIPNDKIVGHAISVIYPFEEIRSLA